MITCCGTGCGCQVTVCRPVQVSHGISARTRVPPVTRVSTRKLPRTAETRSSSPRRNLPAYTLGSSTVERKRLRSQADDLRPHSEELFGRIGVKPGWNALDLGCGHAATSGCSRS
jgi:hypothetical protein